MGFLRQQKSRHGNKEYQKLSGNKAKHPVPKIARYKESGDNSSAGQNTEQQQPRKQSIKNQGEDNSDQIDLTSNLNSSQQKSTSAANSTSEHDDNSDQKKEEFMLRELDPALPRFGPSFREDSQAIKAAKDEAWENILNNTKGDKEQPPTDSVYLQAIKNIEEEARGTYDPDIVGRLKKSEFRWMMIKDGCFFLQLALSILGGSKLLGFPEQHVYFGTVGNDDIDKRTSQWIKAMYFVGNQIPCVVLRELVKQNFFQSVIRGGFRLDIWPCLHLDLPKMVLYLMVVEPELKKNHLIPSSSSSSSSGFFSKMKFQKQAPPYFREQPADLLHACHCLVLGTGNYPLDNETAYALDLEAGERDLSFPSATELRKSGIKLRKANNGIKEIHFGRFLWYWGRLYVPPFTIDGETEHMLHYLKGYEQQLDKEEREVTAYLRFIKDLVRSSRDFWILENEGIIEMKEINPKHNLQKMLDRLVPSKEIPLSLNLRIVRLQMKEYSELPRNLLSLALFLTVVQTIFTVLAYFVPRN